MSKGAVVAQLVHARDLAVGDMITEVDTPMGPYYKVLQVGPGTITIEGREPTEGESLPVPLNCKGYVLRLAK